MHDKLDKVPEGDWMCEECMVKSQCQTSEIPVNLESGGSSNLNFKSPPAWKRQTEGVSSTSHSSAERHSVPSEVQSVKKDRFIRMSAEPPVPCKPCYNTLQRREFSRKNLKNEKEKATKNITSKLQISCNSQEKAKVPHACGDKRSARTSEIELANKRMALETRATFPKASEPTSQNLLSKEPPFKKLEAASSVHSVKQSSYGSQGKPKLPSRLGNASPTLGSQTATETDKCSLLKSGSSKTADIKFKEQLAKVGYLEKQSVEQNIAIHDIREEKNLGLVPKPVSLNSARSAKLNGTGSEVILPNANRSMVLKNSSSAEETKASKGKYVSASHNPAMCLLASESGVAAAKCVNKTISCNETFISGSNCCRLDAVQSCGQLGCPIQPNSNKTHKDLNCLNEETKNKSLQAEGPIEAATAMKLHELGSQFEAATLSNDFFVPIPDCIWQGKFQIHRVEGIACTCVEIQAHLSIYASQKVVQVVDRLPDIIVLEELPRRKMWPSQFMESQATEENIALYFFANDLYSCGTYYRRLIEYMSKNDLALKGNLDGVELLIFSSNVLPEKSESRNTPLFLWGVFGECKIGNSVNTTVSNSQKQENRDIGSWALDVNVVPEDGSGIVRVHEIDQEKTFDGKEKTSKFVIDLNLSPLPESATPEDGPLLSVGNEGVNPNKDFKDSNSADNVELHGNPPMGAKNKSNNDKPSTPPSLSLVENLELLHWQAVLILFTLSKGLRKP
ncbi:uncharacterized protein LOC113860076 [Abrus precatorius]|uniref:Uncharacterized protein LOC113860076 n=1 Tax=Abrus precatorius TaxID=3816 RepID=A0A8B8KYR5_ABRPR|nr:uncharacterized protein LOC113860076 [Abrus precatorius]